MIYKIIEETLTIEGYYEDGTIGFIQPFNSFTGEKFKSVDECKEYCDLLGCCLETVE